MYSYYIPTVLLGFPVWGSQYSPFISKGGVNRMCTWKITRFHVFLEGKLLPKVTQNHGAGAPITL